MFSIDFQCFQLNVFYFESLIRNFFDENELVLETNDIYKELRLRGYDYGSSFQCLTKAVVCSDRVKASIKWTNWVSFADSMIQMAILGKTSRGLYLPVRIDSLRCDPRELIDQAKSLADGEVPHLSTVFDFHLGLYYTLPKVFDNRKAFPSHCRDRCLKGTGVQRN
jgi:hypothetical protein